MRGTALLIAAIALAAFGMASGVRALADGAASPRACAAPPVPAPTRALDEYGNISWADERARLDNFAIELMNSPDALGHVTCYGGRVGRRGEARRRCERARNYVTGYRHIDASRVVTVDGGYREDLTVVLWIVPPRATPPQPTSTVDPRDVRFVRGKSKAKPRGRS
jgi:hypothetical protein